MCEICHGVDGCLPGCPNAPEPKKIYTCEYCGEDIIEGDEYYEFDNRYYHEECFHDCAINLLLDECGARHGVAEDLD
jgi:hypothetical protein